MSATTGKSRLRPRLFSFPVKLVLIVASVLVGLVGTATMASAWHATISAHAECSGVVTYQSSAWDNHSANPKIEIAYSANGADGPWTVVKVGAFNQANNFAFGGTFTPIPDAPGTIVTVRANALAPWGDGTVESNPQYTDVSIPDQCPRPLSVKLACPSSVVYGEATTFTAVAKGGRVPYAYSWTLNRAAVGTNSPSLTLTLKSFKDVVLVTVTDSNEGQATARASCEGRQPPPTPPTVTMSCPAGFVYGQAATWTATATPGTTGDALSYRWTLNSVQVGTDSPSLTTTLNSANDKLAVTVTETAGETTLSATATAACDGTHPAPKVGMTCPAGFIYGQAATWTANASPAVAGDTLSYRWTLDGVLVGTNSPSVKATLHSAKDVLTVTVTETFVDGKTSTISASQTCAGKTVVLIPPIQIVNPDPVAVTPVHTLPFTGRNLPGQLALAAGLLGAGLILLRLSGGRSSLGRRLG